MNIKKKLRLESKMFVPDIKMQVLSAVGFVPKPKINYFHFSLKTALTFSLLIFTAVSLFFIQPIEEKIIPNTIISVDINPSVELEVDKNNKIIAIRALNYDAVVILADQENTIINQEYTDGITRFVEMARVLGYLEEDNNDVQIVITAVNDNQDQENLMNYFLNQKISMKLEEKNIHAKSLVISADNNIRTLAKQYSVSAGKMVVIQKAMDVDSTLTVEECAKLSIKKLNEIVKRNNQLKINEFKTSYIEKITLLKGYKNSAESETDLAHYEMMSIIENINEMVDANSLTEAKNQLIEFLNSHFPYITLANLNQKSDYYEFLAILKIKIDEYKDNMVSMINGKYQTQVGMFNNKLKDDFAISDDYDLEFDFDYNFRFNINPGNIQRNADEERAFRLIEQMNTLMGLAERNHQIRNRIKQTINPLSDEFNELMDSDKLTDDFKNSEEVQNFIDRYNKFMK